MPVLATGVNSNFITGGHKQLKKDSISWVQDMGADRLQVACAEELLTCSQFCGKGECCVVLVCRCCWRYRTVLLRARKLAMRSNYSKGLSSPSGWSCGCLWWIAAQAAWLCSRDAAFGCAGPAEPGQDEGSSCVGSQRRVCPESSLAFSSPAKEMYPNTI